MKPQPLPWTCPKAPMGSFWTPGGAQLVQHSLPDLSTGQEEEVLAYCLERLNKALLSPL